MSECHECNEIAEKLYPDYRTPPLKEEPCLCISCAESASYDAIEEHYQEAERIELEIRTHLKMELHDPFWPHLRKEQTK